MLNIIYQFSGITEQRDALFVQFELCQPQAHTLGTTAS